MHGHRVVLAGRIAHHDEIVHSAGLEKRRRELVRPVRLILLFIAEGDDARRTARRQAAAEGLQKEAPHPFEVADQIASGALAGGGVEFEVGRSDLQPGILRSGRQAGGKGETGDNRPFRGAEQTR